MRRRARGRNPRNVFLIATCRARSMLAVFQHQEGVLDLGVAATTSLQSDHLLVPVVDEAVLATGKRRGPAGNAASGSPREAVQVVSAT